MLGKTLLGTVQNRSNASTPIMSTDNDMFDLQGLDCKLKHGHTIQVRGIDKVRDVTMHEDFAGLQTCDDIGRHSAIGTANPEELWSLQSNQALEEVRVRCKPSL